MGEQRLLTISQAAARLGVHPNTLRAWADKGLVPHVKLPSGYRRFTVAEIERVRQQIGLPPSDGGEHAPAARGDGPA
ncbi:MAG TPA: MerR family transcriptional regulator [Thermomicrobiales bacterium]|nr:MerR family transcriptional regulator [Thermomicrobiales bacterium]